MRFWITKNSELSVREQLVRQVILAILSEDLAPGHKLPSTRAMARRHKIHSNTVSAAYHQLLEQGWLELRRGSGLYVSLRNSSAAEGSQLERLLIGVLQGARGLGHEPEEVLHRLERLIHPRQLNRIVIVEPDAAMRQILLTEIGDRLSVPVVAIEPSELAAIDSLRESLIVGLPTRVTLIRRHILPGMHFVPLRLRSVRGSLEGQVRPAADAILTIVSGSASFRQWSRAVLIAVGIEPDCLCEIDTELPDWLGRVCSGTLAIADIVAAGQLPSGCPVRAFRVIADASIAEMAQICGSAVTVR